MKYQVAVTRADVREFVENTSSGDVVVDAVVAELDAKLQLVGDHTPTTVLTPSTIQQWIAIRVKEVRES